MVKIALATTKGKEFALKKLKERREKSEIEGEINNSGLPEGSSMHYYCIICGCTSDVLPEDHRNAPEKLCEECKALRECGWLE